ncbi:MAG: DUF1501 domain-containing protein, partial [Planctomycetaceae bacterium]
MPQFENDSPRSRYRLSRRQLLRGGLASSVGLTIGGGLPAPWLTGLANEAAGSERILVVIQLSGGNDGLNTVVPYRDELYRKARPVLGIATADLHRLNDDLGLHPSLGGAAKLLEQGRFAIVQGVGYEQPNRSHFESMDIWHTGRRKENRSGEGWLGRFLASSRTASPADSLGLHLGQEQQPLALAGRDLQIPSIASVDQFRLKVAEQAGLGAPVNGEGERPAEASGSDELLGFLESSAEVAIATSGRLEQALQKAGSGGDFPATQLGEKLRVVARLILAGLSTKVYYVTLDGFDTHSQQPAVHAALLRQWSDALVALVQSLEQAGQADRVLVMTFSEFGRRVQENASQGTDHGAAA